MDDFHYDAQYDDEGFGFRQGASGAGGRMGPIPVMLTVCIDPAPVVGTHVAVTVKLPCGATPYVTAPMENCGTGDRRLWRTLVQIDSHIGDGYTAGRRGPAKPPRGGNFGSKLRGGTGGEMEEELPVLFGVTYSIVTEAGVVVSEEKSGTHEETGNKVRGHYYHKCQIGAETKAEPFCLFVEEELHNVQWAPATLTDYLGRIQDLCAAKEFTVDRPLLDKVLVELISRHWSATTPAPIVVLAVSALITTFLRREKHKAESILMVMGKGDVTHTPPEPLAKVVCRWVVSNWTAHIDNIGVLRATEIADPGATGSSGGGAHDRRSDNEEPRSIGKLRQAAYQGLKDSCVTLLLSENSFEWFRLLTVVSTFQLPQPLAASMCEPKTAKLLSENFQKAAQGQLTLIMDFVPRQERAIEMLQDPKQKSMVEMDMQRVVGQIIEGLFRYCPSVESLCWLVHTGKELMPRLLQTFTPLVLLRLRSIEFGKDDKHALQSLIREVTFVRGEEISVALLENPNHPNKAFSAKEIINFIKAIMVKIGRTSEPEIALGPLVESSKRWLRRHYARQEWMSTGGDGEEKFFQETKKAIAHAISGWDLVLSLRCFDVFAVRMLLFDLSQTHCFRDPAPLVLLAALLEVEDCIQAIQNSDLYAELISVGVRAVRGAQEAIPELSTKDVLLQLLFSTPTPLRFELIDALVMQRNASPGLRAVLSNEAIWTLLLSAAWIGDQRLSSCNLGQTQRKGQELLDDVKTKLTGGTVKLGDLTVIVASPRVFCSLAQLAINEDLTAKVKDSTEQLRIFDRKLEQLGVYTKLFCSNNSDHGSIQASDLAKLVEDVRDRYDGVQLKDAMPLIERVKVWPHLDFLFALRSSNVFAGLWEMARTSKGDKTGAELTQDQVVKEVIPAAKKAWEDLSEGIASGDVKMGSVRWIVSYDWQEVQQELRHFESTTKAAGGMDAWAKASESAQAMRTAARLRLVAPAVLQLRSDIPSLFRTPMETDVSVQEIRKLSDDVGKMWDMALNSATTLVAPYAKTFSMLKVATENLILQASTRTAPLAYLVDEAKSTESFNGLIEVCRPNTDDPRVLWAIAAMQQTRTLLAEAIYTKPPYTSTKDFLAALGAVNIEEADLRAAEAMQINFDPLLDLLTKKSRTPGVQACYDLKMLCETGSFRITCTAKKSAQMVCCVPEGRPWHRQELADLRQQLLMTDVPPELEGQQDLPRLIEDFVTRCLLLEEYSACTQELFNLGSFQLEMEQVVLTLKPTDTVGTMQGHLQALQEKLESWQTTVKAARTDHYFLNFFTVYELRLMAKSMPLIKDNSAEAEAAWLSLWPLLRSVAPGVDEADSRKRLMTSTHLSALKEGTAGALPGLGRILYSLFAHITPTMRHLKGLSGLKSDEQGDLLIRKNEEAETGVPIFVCSVDDETKVTEAVLSIYARRERVPEAEELLFCSSTTTTEEIELLVRRFLNARANNREDHIFCLGSTHLLPYTVQCRAAEVLRYLEECVGFQSASCLAVVCGGTRQQVLNNALLSRRAHAVAFPAERRAGFLREAVGIVGKLYHGRAIEAVASDINGGGKSHWIFKTISELQTSMAGGRPMYHRVEVREATDCASLVCELLADATDPSYPTAFHINLAHILPAHVDTLLFQLLIVGILHDSKLGVVYHRRKQDIFFVEIPNTPNEATAKALPFVMLLPRTFLKVEALALSYDKPVFTDVDGTSSIEMQRDLDLVLLGKFLASMEIEEFDPNNKKYFNIKWTLEAAPEVELFELYRLLEKVCCQENEPPSWLLFTGFKNFLASLLKLQEKFPVGSKLEIQKMLHFNGLKHCFIKLLIETTRSLALRQIPKGNIDFETHALAPPAPSVPTLMRALSLTRESSLGSRGAQASADGPPILSRMTSRTTAPTGSNNVPAAASELEKETSGVGRIVVTSYISRFAKMQSWETIEHPVAYFVLGPCGNVMGCQVMTLNPEYTSKFIPQTLQRTLELQGITLKKDWSRATHQEAVKCVLDVEGGRMADRKHNIDGPEEYVVTADNLIKLMTIQQRLKYGLPVCLMGETGCGKTALVRFLAKTLEIPLLTLDVHGGITETDICGFMDRALARGAELPSNSGGGVLVFFDEVNAANCMGLFKTLICDRMHRGKCLPLSVRIVSCCNPYRQRMNKELEAVALTYEHKGEGGEASGINDPMRSLVYRVHPLAESLLDAVSDFGALTDKSLSLYIKAILMKELMPPQELQAEWDRQAREARAKAVAKAGLRLSTTRPAAGLPKATEDEPLTDYEIFVAAFRDLLCASHEYVREAHDGERSVVSMRDVARAVSVCKWFLTYYAKLKGVQSPATASGIEVSLSHGVSSSPVRISVEESMRPHLRTAVVLTLGYCYHSRLSREQRTQYRNRLCKTFEEIADRQPRIRWLDLSSEKQINDELIHVQYEFVSQMQLGEGIALNEALRENLFMLLVSIMNQIPILLVGKPGCSKSLAMDLLKSNLNGEVSEREFFRSMPAVEVFAYQCSPMSTPEAILYAFESARRSNIGDKKTIVCVLLDEVGLAEESPHLPLKVLHRELEHLDGIACVGISNWALDAAKMNRCVMLYRPPPTVEDLRATAEGMAGTSANLRGYLKSLSEAFFDIYKQQKQTDFWGMREFYSTIRALNVELHRQAAQGLVVALEPEMLMKVVLRNFGGRPKEDVDACVSEFFDRVGMGAKSTPRLSKEELVRQNLCEPSARHLMLLTRNNAALRLLFETGLLAHQSAEMMFGGTFPGDQSDIFVAMNLQRVKTFMQRPVCLILVHCDALYESLYDLLNQHYMEYVGQRYVRIAHGSMSKQCPIHKNFRIIVVVEEHDAYYRLAPPLLNRFEKQVFHRRDLMTVNDNALQARIVQFWEALLAGIQLQGGKGAKSAAVQRCAVAGFHPELLGSLVFAVRRRRAPETPLQDLFQEARSNLTWVLTPEAVCLIAARKSLKQALGGFDIVDEYFRSQQHIDLPSFMRGLLESKALWCDSVGAQIVTMTYSPLRGKVADIVSREIKDPPTPILSCNEVMLHELSSSQDLEREVAGFYRKADLAALNILLIRADTTACSLRMIEYSRFVCEKARVDFVQRASSIATGAAFVVFVVHFERGFNGFSFDFDSQWQFAFLDSIEPIVDEDSCGLPGLGEMLHTPLYKVVDGCDFTTLLRRTFREALARLVYPHRRQSIDLQVQVKQVLQHLDDKEFVDLCRAWALGVLAETKKRSRGLTGESDCKETEENNVVSAGAVPTITVGEDTEWFADVAAAAQELMLAGTLRAALHQRILTLVASLLTVFMAHMDRNGGFALLSDPSKHDIWLLLAGPTLTSSLSTRLKNEAGLAAQEMSTARREVITDAHSQDHPFIGRFPSSWFISKTLDNLHPTVKPLPSEEQLAALETQYKLTPLHAIGFNTSLERQHLEDYLADFTAMHVDWTHNLDRERQMQLMRAILSRAKGSELSSILEIHCLFWLFEKQVRFCVGLVDAVPKSLGDVEKLIQTAPLPDLNAQLLLVVHRLLIAELQIDTPRTSREAYRAWLHRKMMVAGLTEDFFVEQGTVGGPLLVEIRSDTEPRIETLATFVRHMAYPLGLDCAATAALIRDLPAGQLRTTSSFAAVLRVVDRSLANSDNVEATLDCGRSFIESWILDISLREGATNFLEPSCVRLFCQIASGLPVKLDSRALAGIVSVGLEDDGEPPAEHEGCDSPPPLAALTDQFVPRLPSFSLALLRKLMKGLVGESNKTATQTLEELLVTFFKKRGHNDSVFSKDYAVVREEAAAARLLGKNVQTGWPQMTLAMIAPTAQPDKALLYIGHVRWMLTQYASEICQQGVGKMPDTVALRAMEAKTSSLLCDFDGEHAPLSRSLRLFVMKTIERAKGVTFLRGALASEPVASMAWVCMWRGRHDMNFEKFIGSSKVPTWSPFIFVGEGEEVLAEFPSARSAVLALITSYSTAGLDEYFASSSKWAEYTRRRKVGALLMAVCAEPGMMSPLEEAGRPPPPWRSVMNGWFTNSQHLPIKPHERNLLRIFSGDDSKIQNLHGPSKEPLLHLFSIAGGRSMDVLFLWRVLGHLAATLIAASPTSLLATLRTLMLEPHTMMTTKQPDYLPGMDEDIRHRIQRAFGQGAGYHFENHWYKCATCGNRFYIGECSKPMQEATCPGCGAVIGGTSHRPTAQTIQDDALDTSPPGYTLPKAAEDEKHLFFRDVHATSARTIRLLVHGAMCLGLIAQLPDILTTPPGTVDGNVESGCHNEVKDIMPRVYGHITNEESTCTMHQDTEAVYLSDHFHQDWKLLAENLSSHAEGVAMGMHNLLLQMGRKGPDAPMKKKEKVEHWWDQQTREVGLVDTNSDWSRLAALKRRGLWEETMDEKYLLPWISKFEETLLFLHNKWSNKEDESGPLVSELREIADVATFPVERRRSEMPQVLAYRATLTLHELQRRLPQAKKHDDLRVLSTLLETHSLETVKALRTLVGQFQWHQLVEQRFSGRITRQEAQDMTIGKAIENEPRGERAAWEHAFQKLESAWQDAFQYVDRFECLEIPAHLKTFYITRESGLSCAIADEKDLGICPLVLTQWLVARHNDLVQSAALAGGYPIRKEKSTTIGHHDVIVYDKDTMMRYIRDRCVTHGPGGRLNLDLVELERHLRHEFAKPELSFHLRLFQWLGESSSGSNILSYLIKQKELTPEVDARIKAEIRTPVQAAMCLQKMQMAATFIVNSRDVLNLEVMCNMKVCDYLSSVLAEPPDAISSSTARAEVQLQHMDSFVRLLKSVIHSNPMEQLPLKYKADLDASLRSNLGTVADAMEELLERIVRAMRGLVDNLAEGGVDAEQKMTDWLCAYLELQFEDSECAMVVKNQFPAALQLKHWEATYLLLKEKMDVGEANLS